MYIIINDKRGATFFASRWRNEWYRLRALASNGAVLNQVPDNVGCRVEAEMLSAAEQPPPRHKALWLY